MAQEKVALSKIAGSNFAHILWQRHISQKEFAAIVGRTPRKRQTSPRIKGRHLKENCCSPRWRSFIYEAYSILPGHLQEAAFQPMLHQFRSAAARFAGAIADNGTDPNCFPSPFHAIS